MTGKRDIEKVTADFREAMLEKLRENEHKKHWNEASISYLMQRLMVEIDELKLAFSLTTLSIEEHSGILASIEDTMKECADVANFAMMIYDNLRNGIIDGSTDSKYLEGKG